MKNKIWQWLVKTWSALTGKISLAVQIASVLSLSLVSVLVILLVANRLGVEDSFLRLLGILFSPTLVICALVLYLWRRHESHIGDLLSRITKLDMGPFRALVKSDKMISDPVSSRGKPDNKSEASLSDTAISSGSPNHFNEIEKKAARRDAEAQFNLGVLYDDGKGVKQNYAKAAIWYQRAAEQGHAQAQVNLGISYYAGKGVKQNHAEAAIWYQRAAEQGHAQAQYNLGVLYDNGEGVKQNHAEAAIWYQRAAEQGHAQAQYNLGVSYDDGEGVEQNHAEAAIWYQRAAEQGYAQAQVNLGVSYDRGEGVAQNYSEAYIWFSLAFAGNAPNAKKSRDRVARKLGAETMKNAQAEATRREKEIRRKRESESQ